MKPSQARGNAGHKPGDQPSLLPLWLGMLPRDLPGSGPLSGINRRLILPTYQADFPARLRSWQQRARLCRYLVTHPPLDYLFLKVGEPLVGPSVMEGMSSTPIITSIIFAEPRQLRVYQGQTTNTSVSTLDSKFPQPRRSYHHVLARVRETESNRVCRIVGGVVDAEWCR